jgi:hypothetical protein
VQPEWPLPEFDAAAHRPRRITQAPLSPALTTEELEPRVVRLERMLSLMLGTLRRMVAAMSSSERPIN